MTSPRQIFVDNIRPADILLRVYRLLNTDDHVQNHGELVEALRSIVQAADDEGLMVVYNEIFLGLVREAAEIPTSTLRRSSLAHFLRQAVVASCTSLETYLPAILQDKLPMVIKAMGRDFINFIPKDDPTIKEKFKTLTFSLDEMLRLLADPNAAEYTATKIIGFIGFSYLSGSKGVHVVGKMVGISQPLAQIAERINRDPVEVERILNETVTRRNDIVHRADRNQKQIDGKPQEITYVWAMQSIDTIRQVCLALDDLIKDRVMEFEAVIQENEEK
jgi:hypothetical protein